MATSLDLIKRSLRMLGVLGTGITLEPEQANDGLEALNSMLDSWSTDRLHVYEILEEEFPLVSGVQTYTIGPGGDFDTVRPSRIEGGYCSNFGSDYTFQIIDVNEWNSINYKNVGGTWPSVLKYDAIMPLGRISLFPIPQGGTITLNTFKMLQSFPDLTTVVSLPAGYERAIASNLAIEVAPEYQKTVSAELAKIARDSKANIQRINLTAPVLDLDAAISNRAVGGNILSGFHR